jgi:hypothetical protein
LVKRALLTQLAEGYKSNESVHKEIEGSYFIMTARNGKKYLQIDTYWSDEREIPGKISQSIQFSLEAIEQLKKILLQYF